MINRINIINYCNVHFIGEIWTSLIKMGNDYYPIFRIWTFFETHIHICHPDDIEVYN